MKKILLVLALIPVVASVGIAKSPDLSTCKKQTFIVTGYYSPIEGQTFYYKGSLEADKKLNGQGVRGASGKAVFNGMLAAPKTYEFGTKIYFPGYGMGQVEDRGGAIVTAGNRNYSYDRIDIWLGSGEDGLKRALSFGKRELVGYVCPDGDIGFNMGKFPIYNNLFKDVLWNVTLGVGKTDNNVRTLQTHLKDLGYLTNKEV
ncbi:MAG: 3D domain-containing protein, partial [Candidatus Absconditabacteria bacterium]